MCVCVLEGGIRSENGRGGGLFQLNPKFYCGLLVPRNGWGNSMSLRVYE